MQDAELPWQAVGGKDTEGGPTTTDPMGDLDTITTTS